VKITVKLFAVLGRYLPSEAVAHAVQIEVNEGISALQVLERFGVPPAKIHLVLLNGVYLHPDERTQPIIQKGDTLSVWPPVAGG